VSALEWGVPAESTERSGGDVWSPLAVACLARGLLGVVGPMPGAPPALLIATVRPEQRAVLLRAY
jgi:hypothetical protein